MHVGMIGETKRLLAALSCVRAVGAVSGGGLNRVSEAAQNAINEIALFKSVSLSVLRAWDSLVDVRLVDGHACVRLIVLLPCARACAKLPQHTLCIFSFLRTLTLLAQEAQNPARAPSSLLPRLDGHCRCIIFVDKQKCCA